MGKKIVVGPIPNGLRTDVLPFNIDNTNFSKLINAYQQRARVKRKRGTTLLKRFQRFLGTTDVFGNITVIIEPASVSDPILTGSVTVTIGSEIFSDPGTTADPADQILITNSLGAVHTLNRTTGVLTITGSIPNTTVNYYPTLPVMGLEDLNLTSTNYPGTLAFDTKYSYNIQTVFPYSIYDVSFYKNPPLDATNLPAYVRKATPTPFYWNGEDYQQFWTTNYQGALWATNGIRVPFVGASSRIGMQFAGPGTTPALTLATRIDSTTMEFTIVGNPLIIGDFVFANEFLRAGAYATGLNLQTGYLITQGDVFRVRFPFANIPAGAYTPGILQYLTNTSDPTVDVLRWYDGDPTNGVPSTQTFSALGHGWVNFMPPLSNLNFSIADLPLKQYYLVGGRMIVPFKDRLLILGPVIQASTDSPIYLQDTIIYSQNGTPYYTSSFSAPAVNYPLNPNVIAVNGQTYSPILLPDNQTATPTAWFEDFTGFGGFISAGVSSPITTAEINDDVLIVGFSSIQTRLVYSGNDIVPFNFFIINSEYGSSSTFSSINLDEGIMTRGNRGMIITNQTSAKRFDVDILDQVFQMSGLENGIERITSQRDFIKEWIYFTYPSNQVNYKFPNQTLFYNYRDQSWAIFNESYTTYGQFRRQTGFTWATVGLTYPSWSEWSDPWNSGSNTLLNPDVIGGNQQGFVMVRDTGTTGEGTSLYIQNITGNTVFSPNHNLNDGDFITISDALGTIGTSVNNKIFSVFATTTDTFKLNPSIPAGTYLGGGYIKRMYRPFIQTRQFPLAWDLARKVRIGVQQYLLTKTEYSQIQLLIFLSQDSASAYNDNVEQVNSGLIYSTVLYTCPESTNLGLTPANTNLQMIVEQNVVEPLKAESPQAQIWHRINTSLIGDTVQLGFTLSDAQMRAVDANGNPISQFSEIELHGFVIDVSPSSLLS